MEKAWADCKRNANLTSGLRNPSVLRGASASEMFGGLEAIVVNWETALQPVTAVVAVARGALFVVGLVTCIVGC